MGLSLSQVADTHGQSWLRGPEARAGPRTLHSEGHQVWFNALELISILKFFIILSLKLCLVRKVQWGNGASAMHLGPPAHTWSCILPPSCLFGMCCHPLVHLASPGLLPPCYHWTSFSRQEQCGAFSRATWPGRAFFPLP